MSERGFVEEIAAEVQAIAGVVAVVLGGSRARGTATPASDVDLGLYYEPGRPLDVAALDALAARLDDGRRPGLLTRVGGWGQWIDGGGWLTVRGVAVDFLYRDVARVAAVVSACRSGQIEFTYQPGHPHGFLSAIYMGEVAVCRPLADPHGRIAALKALTDPYPDALARAIVARFGWEVGFALECGRKAAARGDVAYAAGSAFRSVACLLQLLFAANRQYWLNEKGAVALADRFAVRPRNLRVRVEAAFRSVVTGPRGIEVAMDELAALAREVEALMKTVGKE